MKRTTWERLAKDFAIAAITDPSRASLGHSDAVSEAIQSCDMMKLDLYMRTLNRHFDLHIQTTWDCLFVGWREASS